VKRLTRTTILDDFDSVKKVDKSNMLSFCIEAPKHYGNAAKLANQVKLSYPKPKMIIVGGMGGSAIGGDLLKDWARSRMEVPIEVCRDYKLPAYANKDTLTFVTSYSGETEEALSVFLDALKRRCMTVCISSGGTLQEYAEKLGIPHLLVPSGMAPRATLPYLFVPLPGILEKIGLASGLSVEYSETVNVLRQISMENSPERLLSDNLSKTLALAIEGTIPSVYGFGIFRAVAQRFKTQINENSKNPAKWEFFPELNHNEIVGWEAAKEFAEFLSVIFIRDSQEPEEIRQRIEVTKEIIRRETSRLFEVWSKGESTLAKMASVICIGDFTSVYLAVLRGIDPTPVRTIDVLKKRLKETGVKEKTICELKRLAKS
jgi:glucose/mannose-6-phosphate isomerase